MAPQAPRQRHTSVIELASDFSDGGSEYWPGESGYVFKPNDDYYHRSLASQWMESIGESRKGTSAVFVSASTLSYHIISIKRCSKICLYVSTSLLLSPFSWIPRAFYVPSHLLFNPAQTHSHISTQILDNPLDHFFLQLIHLILCPLRHAIK